MASSLLQRTSREFDQIRSDLVKGIPALTDKWTDFNESDLGMAFVSIIAAVADNLAFYSDKNYLEARLLTAKERKNIRANLETIGYKMRRPLPEKVMLTFSLQQPHSHDIIIPRFSQVSTEVGDVNFVILEDRVWLAGQTSIQLEATQGDLKEVLIKTNEINVDSSRISLRESRVAEGCVFLFVGTLEWSEVENLSFYPEGGLIFSVDENDEGIIEVALVADWYQVIPRDETLCRVVFLKPIEDGLGKVKPGKITRVISLIEDTEGVDVTDLISVTNVLAAEGGLPAESIEEAKIKAPRLLRSM